MTANRLGVLAFGDSITNGGGELQWGVALQSWALWVARATGLPFSGYAVDGAGVGDVLRSQIPAFVRTCAHPDERYELGCLYIGVNDVRGLDWDAARFAAEYAQALEFVRGRCDRVLALTAPLDLGRPRAGAKVAELNDVIRHAAARAGAIVLDLSDFGARNLVMADHVHPTALGQVAIAERALAVLGQHGLETRWRPSEMIAFETTRLGRLRSDLTYVYRRSKEGWRGLRFKAGLLRP